MLIIQIKILNHCSHRFFHFPAVDARTQDLFNEANYEKSPLNYINGYYEPGPGTGFESANEGRFDNPNLHASMFRNLE